MAKDGFDVVVAGGGIIGCSIAYYLAREGLAVAILEPDGLGSGSSGHATGSLSMLGAEFEQGPSFDLAMAGYRTFSEVAHEIEEDSGQQIHFQKRPALRLALDEDEAQAIRTSMQWQSTYLPVEWIDGDGVRRIEPRLSGSILGAAYEPESAQVDSYRVTLALGRAAERHGAVIFQRRLTGVEGTDGRVTAARHQSGTIDCDQLVIAMGPWSGECSSWLSAPLPVVPMKGERLLLRFDGPPLPAFLSSPKRGHMISMADGLLSAGSTGGRDYDKRDAFRGTEFDSRPTEAAMMELMQRAIDVFPALEDAQIVQQLAGSRPLSGDLHPIIGPAPGNDGVFLATGHTTKGIHLGPITGLLVKNYLTDGNYGTDIDMSAFLPDRFLGQEPDYERVGHNTEE